MASTAFSTALRQGQSQYQYWSWYLAVSLASTILALFLERRISRYLARRKVILSHGCKDVKKYPHQDILGLDVTRAIGKQIAASCRLESLKKWYDTYGSTYSVRVFGQRIIYTIDPENLRAIFANNFHDYGLQPFRLPASKPAIGRNIFTTDGPYWKHSRDQVTPIFTRARLSDMSGFEEHFEQMLAKVPRDGSAFDMMPLIEDMFINSALDFLFGSSTSSQTVDSEADKAEFLGAFNQILMGIGRRTRLGRFRWFVRDKTFSTACKRIQKYADKYLQLALRNTTYSEKDNRYIFLNEMVKNISDHEFIRNNLLAVYVAGHESTAILLSNLMFLTSRHPEVWEKLRQEALAVQNQPVTFELLKSLRYLHQVINETLRIYPIVVQSTRVALKDTILPTGGGEDGTSPILVKKGWSVVYNPFALHRRTEAYGEDAEEFKPERWDTLRQNWHYLPFGGGPRICPAQQLALTEASYSLFRLLLLFKENRSCDDRPWTEGIKLTVRNKNGTKIALVPA